MEVESGATAKAALRLILEPGGIHWEISWDLTGTLGIMMIYNDDLLGTMKFHGI